MKHIVSWLFLAFGVLFAWTTKSTIEPVLFLCTSAILNQLEHMYEKK